VVLLKDGGTSSEHDKRQSRVYITDQALPTVDVLKKRDQVVVRMTHQRKGTNENF